MVKSRQKDQGVFGAIEVQSIPDRHAPVQARRGQGLRQLIDLLASRSTAQLSEVGRKELSEAPTLPALWRLLSDPSDKSGISADKRLDFLRPIGGQLEKVEAAILRSKQAMKKSEATALRSAQAFKKAKTMSERAEREFDRADAMHQQAKQEFDKADAMAEQALIQLTSIASPRYH